MAKKENNTEKPKNKGGRPATYTDPELLERRINEYFQYGMNMKTVQTKDGEKTIPVPTISGLALYLGFSDRHSFYDYQKRPQFSHVIKKARARMETHYEELLQSGVTSGAIFALKQFGWTDKQETIQTNYNVELSADDLKKLRESLEDEL